MEKERRIDANAKEFHSPKNGSILYIGRILFGYVSENAYFDCLMMYGDDE